MRKLGGAPGLIAFAALASGGGCVGAPPAPVRAQAPATAKTARDEQSSVAAIRSICGFTFVGNGGGAHFMLDVAGEDLSTKTVGENDFFAVDDVILQVKLVTRRQIGSGAAGKSGVALLRAHEAWEVEHFSSLAGKKLFSADVVVPIKMGGAARSSGLAWWVLLPEKDLGGGLTPPVFLTAELADHVLVLGGQGTRAQPLPEVSARLAYWMRALSPRADYMQLETVSADIGRRSTAGEECADPAADRRLRLGEIANRDRAQIQKVASTEGGVVRREVPGHRRYRNNICRFELDYPAGWEDFDVQDFNGKGCLLNLTTPKILDPDENKEITNAVALMAARAQAGYGQQELHEWMTRGLRKVGAKFEPVTPPPVEGARDERFRADAKGTTFVGEVVTFQRGESLYSLNFTATKGTYSRGRARFLEILLRFKWDIPPTIR